MPAGFEGLHVFDISDKADPKLLTSVELPCGSHTATAVPDPDNGRLIVHNQTSGGRATSSTWSRFRWTPRRRRGCCA